jgi:quercetin dioxygenase-like cupin family protein
MTKNPVALKASRANLNRLPFLAGTSLKFNLKDELRQLRSRESWQRNSGRSSKTLAKYPDLHIVLILMKPDTKMNEHHVDGRTSIQLLQGRLRVHLPSESVEIHAGDLLTLEYGILHHVEALEESAFVITISWPGGTKAERHARYSVS